MSRAFGPGLFTEETQQGSFCFFVGSTLTFRSKITKSKHEDKNLFAGGLR